jgi:hypothetical protein
MQNRITAICRQLGYSAKPEHDLTPDVGVESKRCLARADVYVEPGRVVVEVQQRNTNFGKRTLARAKCGAAQTIWLVSHDANEPGARKALFAFPAARFKVVDRRLPREQRAVEFEPWEDSAALDEFAVVDVWATTWQLIEEQPYLQTCKLDLHLFLKQVLEGRRVWVDNDPVMLWQKYGRPGVGWVLLDDLDEVRARQARDREAAEAAAAAQLALPAAEESGDREPGAQESAAAPAAALAPPEPVLVPEPAPAPVVEQKPDRTPPPAMTRPRTPARCVRHLNRRSDV